MLFRSNNRVVQSAQSLLNQVNNQTVGFAGIASSKIPGTPAYNFKSQLDTLKSNIAFGALQQMRNASKTGGALRSEERRVGKECRIGCRYRW